MGACAVELARAVGYVGAGTVEMLLDVNDHRSEHGAFHFMEMNTRLQVEHPVTEALLGVDLVEWQLRVARGEPLPLSQEAALEAFERGGHAIEVRLCAEDPLQGDLPQSGMMLAWQPPQGVRVDHALESGVSVPPFYDSMLAKLVSHAPTRDAARNKLAQALDHTLALGIPTNRALLSAVLRHDDFAQAHITTRWLEATFAERAQSLPPVPAPIIAAAALWIAHQEAARHPAPWQSSRLAQPLAQRIAMRLRERVIQVDLHPLDIHPLADGGVEVRIDDGGATARFGDWQWQREGALDTLTAQLEAPPGAARDGRIERLRLQGATSVDARGAPVLHLRCDGFDLDVADLRFAPPPRSGSQGAGEVRAPMHGRLAALHVAVGDTVSIGQRLAVLEAMKMEHAIGAPRAGRVRAINAASGAQVSPEQVLIEIDAA
jgi:geranyl-CoA carboxylase alpha subunit